MRADDEFFKRVDDWRRQRDDLPPRAEAVRRLVEIGLQHNAPLPHGHHQGIHSVAGAKGEEAKSQGS